MPQRARPGIALAAAALVLVATAAVTARAAAAAPAARVAAVAHVEELSSTARPWQRLQPPRRARPVAAPPGPARPAPVAAPVRRAAPAAPAVRSAPPAAALTPAAILAGVHYPWASLGYHIAFLGPRPGYLGLTFTASRSIEIFLQPGESAAMATFVTAYEIAHAVDMERNTDASRASWLADRGAPAGTSWWPCDACNEDAHGSGDFANAFAVWATGVPLWRSTVAPEPSPTQLAALAGQFWGGR